LMMDNIDEVSDKRMQVLKEIEKWKCISAPSVFWWIDWHHD